MATDKEYFKYLDDLRKSGVTNMLGSPQYLERNFPVTPNEAKAIFGRWVEQFKND
jgi:hypothetical protein|tara:strand:- start:2486 stop:2650 length:165 start_codon:yes stop_codon:yes gene_type:complete